MRSGEGRGVTWCSFGTSTNPSQAAFSPQAENRLAYPRVWNAELERLLGVWVQHVDLLLSEPEGLTGIYFDKWLVDDAYRFVVGESLGLPRPGNRPAKRGTGGGGSSFEGRSEAADVSGLFNRSELLDGPARDLWERCVAEPVVVEAVARLESAYPISR